MTSSHDIPPKANISSEGSGNGHIPPERPRRYEDLRKRFIQRNRALGRTVDMKEQLRSLTSSMANRNLTLKAPKPSMTPAEMESSGKLTKQLESERTYDITIDTASSREQLSAPEIIYRMEFDHAVKTAPRVDEQLQDVRTNEITYKDSHDGSLHAVTEGEALGVTREYLETAIACGDKLWPYAREEDADFGTEVKSLKEDLTFIGEKEYQEAAAGIALYWKALLDDNPDRQLLVLTGIRKANDEGEVDYKSDDYLLDNILARFSDEEIEAYKGRLTTDPLKIIPKEETTDNLRIVMLDDWTIGGAQLKFAADRFRNAYPEFARSLEIQLIVANNDRVTRGLEDDFLPGTTLPVPVRAYFRAHEASDTPYKFNAHITGAHSSVDFAFQDTIKKVAFWAQKSDILSKDEHAILDAMPPLAKIVRPYQMAGTRLIQKSRLK